MARPKLPRAPLPLLDEVDHLRPAPPHREPRREGGCRGGGCRCHRVDQVGDRGKVDERAAAPTLGRSGKAEDLTTRSAASSGGGASW